MTESTTCTHCGAITDNLTTVGSHDLCPACLQQHTMVCCRCNERIWRDENAGTETTPLCEDCYDYYYTHCTDCGRLLSNDSAMYIDDGDDPYCCSCYENHQQNDVIHDYNYKPTPIFYGPDSMVYDPAARYFGVELEVDGAGEYDAKASEVLDAANSFTEHIYCKHDGSLNSGFEIVTHPMTLDYHLTQMPWEKVCATAINEGYTSHQAMTCGLHIHVNRDSFGHTYAVQEAAIARVLYFFEKHWEELLRFSRRTQRQLERWASRYGYQEQPKAILDNAKKGYNGRYACVNLCNSSTVEFRIFRGTLKTNTILATLQLVNHICELAVCLTDDELKKVSWSSFAAQVTEPELIQYLKERRLYVNEEVEEQEEV